MKYFSLLFLVLSFVFIIPLSISSSYAATTSNENVQNVCGGGLYSNPKNSLVMSVVTMCIPGILEKTQDWKNNKCQKVVCKYDAVTNGLDPSFCEKQEAYKTCAFIVGEVFALPGFAMIDNIRNVVSELLRNPIGYLWSEVAKAARSSLKDCSIAGTCESPIQGVTAIFLAVTDISGVIQTFKDISDFGFKERVDYCEQMDDIKKELEEIIEVRGN